MTDRLLVDLGGDGRAGVLAWPDGGLPEEVSRGPMAWPLDGDALEELRWYLEDYLLAPYGMFEERGASVREKLDAWGEQVFESVFGAGPARFAYERARDRGLEVVFRSDVPGLLGLPWELMRDGAGRVALGAGGISRSLPVVGAARTLEVPGGKLRVLMVISRPADTADVGYQMVARPLLERLAAVRGEVELTVLRPPTLDALARSVREAADAGAPFHVVHFDGHGGMPRPGAGTGSRPGMMAGPADGVLAFEQPGGGSDLIGASQIAAVLVAGKVPVVVLNACQSGAMGKELEASVATALLRAGCAAVVAMAYSVYAVAAAEFMAAFYEALFAGHSVGQAVAAGRRRLFERDGRPSPKGDMPLSDWLVPVHYLRADVRFPGARTLRPAAVPSLDEALDQLRAAPPDTPEAEAAQDPLAAAGVFVGRDDLFYRLEEAARLQRVVVLSGPGGTGKTELAKGFARWWRDTGGIDDPRLVCWHSFEPGIASFGLDGMITAFGLQVLGPDFARLEPAQRLAAAKKLLGEYRCLLVWDNFESVAELPDPAGATPALDEAGRAELREFLHWVRDRAKSTVLVTSRARESWLGEVARITVGGLNRAEGAEYAGLLLAPFPAARHHRGRRAFGELLEWLDGHPLAMRLTLPRLEDASPADLLAGLCGTAPVPGALLPGDGDAGPGRLSSLGACITYSFARLSEPSRRLVPALSMFHGIADAVVLKNFSAVSEVPDRFAGTREQEWAAVLEEAARVGLLSPVGGGLYRIHPALPGYLAAAWHGDNPGAYDEERQAAEQAMRTACAVFSDWLTGQFESGNAARAFAIIGWQRRTLGAMLGHALDHRAWDDAESISEALELYWNIRGLSGEAAAWTDRILAATAGPDQAPTELASALWQYTLARQANRQLSAGQPEQAAEAYRKILAWLQDQPATESIRHSIAGAFHNLGVAAQDQGRLDDAEDWYLKSLAIGEELGDRRGVAGAYHQLGLVAEDLERLGDADNWALKSLAIAEELGDRPQMAGAYHQLGVVAQRQGRLDDAEDWYLKSLAIEEELGDRPHMAFTIHQLGMVAQHRGRLGEAEDWYRKSLVINEELRNLPGLALSYGQLGVLAERRQQPREALDWLIRCVTLSSDFPSPLTGLGPANLAGLARQLGTPVLERAWQEVTGQPVPQAVLDYIANHDDESQADANESREAES